jgi:Fe-S-cluster containining protein
MLQRAGLSGDAKELLQAGMDEPTALHEHGPPCPLLDAETYTVYPVRPVVCRAHYVVSDATSCMRRSDPRARDAPLLIIDEYSRAHARGCRADTCIHRDPWSRLP